MRLLWEQEVVGSSPTVPTKFTTSGNIVSSSRITFIKHGDKFVFHKEGIYYGLTLAQVAEMQEHCENILKEHDTETDKVTHLKQVNQSP